MYYSFVVCLTFIYCITSGIAEDVVAKDTNLLLRKCLSVNKLNEMVNCVGFQLLGTIRRAENETFLEVFPGVILARNTSDASVDNEISEEFPVSSKQKTIKQLADLLLQETSRFIAGRFVMIKLPSTTSQNLARALDEGRGKMKKMMGSLLFGFGSKMMSMVPFVLGGLLLLTTKALVVGKVALVLSAILFVQMIFSRGLVPSGFGPSYNIPPPTYGVPSTSYGTNNIGGGGWGWASGPYKRSMNVEDEIFNSQQNIADQ